MNIVKSISASIRPLLSFAGGGGFVGGLQVTRQPVIGDGHNDALEAFRNQATAIALRKFFDQKYFCISDLKAMLTAARIVPDGEFMRIVQPLHCVDWADMPADFRNDLTSAIIATFRTSDVVENVKQRMIDAQEAKRG